MEHQIFKIYNQKDFNWITRGIKVAQCMQLPSSYISENEGILYQLEDLVVSDSLCCSFCNTVFEDKVQQRLHYKLDWHRYNLKQHLSGLKSLSEDQFNLLADKGEVSSLSGSEMESEDEEESGSSPNEQVKNEPGSKSNSISANRPRKGEKRGKAVEFISDNSDIDYNEEMSKKKLQALSVTASRHTKVFFENEDSKIFSIYRCLLHHKKDIPEVDNKMITQALNSGKNTMWTIIMVGGGHFAAAVFQDGEPVVHKTFHSYTVRAKQGFAQSSRTTGNHPKSAGASLRRYNEASLIQHVQEILESWSIHIKNSSLILYRAVGPYNRMLLFGGKNPPLNKNDIRLRAVPFVTRRATFSEVKRIYDILSTMEIHGPAADFTDRCPNSPRQPIRKKVPKVELMDEIVETDVSIECNPTVSNINSPQETEQIKALPRSSPERQHRNSRSRIDRAKPRKSPHRPLPDIVAKLAQSSSESESDEASNSTNIQLIVEDMEIDAREHLLAFKDTIPRYMKNKKNRRKKKGKKDPQIMNEVLSDAKLKLWAACELGDNDLFSSIIDNLLAEVKKYEQLEEQNKEDITESSSFVNMNDIARLMNDVNEDGNTMLHLAASSGHLKLIWSLLEIGCDPCNKNKKLQTPYAAANDKETRNMFKRFWGAKPDKYNYQKSQIPAPLTDEIEQEQLEKKRQQRKVKRIKEKTKRKEFELKKREENEKQRFLILTDKEKRALAKEQMLSQGQAIVSRCFQCAVDLAGTVPFEYNDNRFCSMPCLKQHRLHHKFVI